MVVAGNIAYHVGLKGMPTGIHPLSPLVVLFTTSAVTALVLRLFTGRGAGLREEIALAGWRPFAVGISIVAIELGFLLAYRAGWKISTAVVTANILVAIALLAVGALAFREPVTPVRLAGIVTCLAGLWLVSRG
jgi:drug/metabolite transporter (DMT)-like permease